MSNRNWASTPRTTDWRLNPPEEVIEPRQGRFDISWDVCEESEETPIYVLNVEWYMDSNCEYHLTDVRCRGVVTYQRGFWEVEQLPTLFPMATAALWLQEGLSCTPGGAIARAFRAAYDSDEGIRNDVRDKAND